MSASTPQASHSRIKKIFDQALTDFMHEAHLEHDPLGLVHTYEDPRDQELVAFIAASFAFGQVKAMRAFLKRLLFLFGDQPHKRLGALKANDFQGLQYRFIHSADIAAFVQSLQAMIRQFGSLEKAFVSSPSSDHLQRLSDFRNAFLTYSPRRSRGIHFLFSNPQRSCGKRWHLFLRWMVRRPPIDLGLWTKVTPSQLMIPLDTHLFDIAKAFRLSREKKPSLKMALEITELLRHWRPEDPVAYDFALCQLGIQKLKASWIRSASATKRDSLSA